MPFDSPQFWLLFMPVVFLLTFLPRRSTRWQNSILLAASLIFYYLWTGYFVLVLIGVTLVNYLAGRLLENAPSTRANFVAVSTVIIDLIILALFKLTLPSVGDNILAPIGLSFYTFQNIGYILEVRRRRMQPVRTVIDYALFSAYFPLVLSGPIERAQHLLPQLQKVRSARNIPLERAVGLIILGLFEKVVLAKITGQWSTPIFAHPTSYSAFQVAAAVYLYAAEIYVDFAGYTNIVRGVSYLFGIELIENFRQPYLSSNITEFWQRWHISLSSWFRDYLFYPLSRGLLRSTGNKYRELVRAASLIITMTLIGLWHGPTWNFLIWGGLHGLYLALHRGTQTVGWTMQRLLNVVITFHAVLLTWIFFGTVRPDDALLIFRQMFRPDSAGQLLTVLPLVLFVYLVIFGIDVGQRITLKYPLPIWLKSIAWGIGLFFIYVLWQWEYQPFVYFKF
jgi:D-alanyl-lipoteichoic acid acyltransferase DltB (MBOAT superfamily)